MSDRSGIPIEQDKWLCPDCGIIIIGPSYPKLHTCMPELVLLPTHKVAFQKLRDIIDRQSKEIAAYTKTNVELLSERDTLAEQVKTKDTVLQQIIDMKPELASICKDNIVVLAEKALEG